MLQIKPNPPDDFKCPSCLADKPFISNVILESVNILMDCCCRVCHFQYYQLLPVGHTAHYAIAIGKKDGQLFSTADCPAWLSESITRSRADVKMKEVSIEKVVYRKCERVVILNTLDYLYGHVLLKLYNCFYHLKSQRDLGLIVIVPRTFSWLVPKGCAEVWIVDLKLNALQYAYLSIQTFVSREFLQFKEIHVSKAHSHPEFSSVDIERLTGVPPFNLALFNDLRPTVTFVLREDRWWFGNRLSQWFFLICRKLKWFSASTTVLSFLQVELIKATIRHIRSKLPETTFNVVGIGTCGNFAGYSIDERTKKVDAVTERIWCNAYAKSHVVIGVHGSNMLLPTALAAGCVEILPADRYGNMAQDLSVRYNNRLQLFFYRFADQYASPKSIAIKAISIIKDYALFHKNMDSLKE